LIQRKRGLLLVGVLTALVALVALFPARVAYKLTAPPYVKMSGLSGTIWNGAAEEFSTNGLYLRNLEWRMSPLSLLTGKARLVVAGEPTSGFFESEVAASLSGKTITLSKLSAALPLAMFARASGVPGLKGDASLQIESLTLVSGRATALQGSMDVGNLVVPALARTSLGGYRADFFTQGEQIVADLAQRHSFLFIEQERYRLHDLARDYADSLLERIYTFGFGFEIHPPGRKINGSN